MMNGTLCDIALNDFKLPIKIQADWQYESGLKEVLDKYIQCLKKQVPQEQTLLKEVQQNVSDIYEALNLYYNAEFTKAQQIIEKMMERYIKDTFIVQDIDKSYAFKGMSHYTNLMRVYDNVE